jgi:hypothetical protein
VYLATLPLGAHLDTIPPVIEHTPVTGGTALRPIEVTATITDNVEVTVATFYYRVGGDTAYTSFTMGQTGDVYTAEIPGSFVSAAGVEYYIEAADGVNTATHPAVDPEANPHVISVTSLQPPNVFSAEGGDGKVKLSWNSVAGASGYSLYRSDAQDTGFELVNIYPIESTDFEDTQVENGKTYYYYITSVDDNGVESTASETKSATPEGDGDGGLGAVFSLILILIVVLVIGIIVYVLMIMKAKG